MDKWNGYWFGAVASVMEYELATLTRGLEALASLMVLRMLLTNF
jgi:hypothetical protein